MKKHTSFFCGDNDSYVHGDLYILVELPLIATFVDGSESSKERKSQGAKVPGTFAPGRNWSWERKVHNSSYGTLMLAIIITVILTLSQTTELEQR